LWDKGDGFKRYEAGCRWRPERTAGEARYRKGREPFGGCTGFGCGAAFNFVAVLADGEVHACRKFPSPIGNVSRQSIAEIYDSEIVECYRSGLDVFKHKDPYCFL
jgi:MoaA/NifB/PqqE/SkfB family radical SAM enzyme